MGFRVFGETDTSIQATLAIDDCDRFRVWNLLAQTMVAKKTPSLGPISLKEHEV